MRMPPGARTSPAHALHHLRRRLNLLGPGGKRGVEGSLGVADVHGGRRPGCLTGCDLSDTAAAGVGIGEEVILAVRTGERR